MARLLDFGFETTAAQRPGCGMRENNAFAPTFCGLELLTPEMSPRATARSRGGVAMAWKTKCFMLDEDAVVFA